METKRDWFCNNYNVAVFKPEWVVSLVCRAIWSVDVDVGLVVHEFSFFGVRFRHVACGLGHRCESASLQYVCMHTWDERRIMKMGIIGVV